MRARQISSWLVVGMLLMPAAWALDPLQYAKAKKAGVAALSKDENGRIWQVFQTFDATTGQNAGERRDEVLVTNLNAQRAARVQEIADIDALLAEIKALTP